MSSVATYIIDSAFHIKNRGVILAGYLTGGEVGPGCQIEFIANGSLKQYKIKEVEFIRNSSKENPVNMGLVIKIKNPDEIKELCEWKPENTTASIYFDIDIWYVSNNELDSVLLWRSNEGTFRVTKQGTYTSLLENPNYLLIDQKYLEVLGKLDNQLSFKKVKIIDHHLQIETTRYVELTMNTNIEPSSIETLDSKGLKIWGSGGRLFVSGDLKELLEDKFPNDFSFSLGFSLFG